MKKLACLFSLLFCFCVSGQNVPVLAKPSGLLVTPPDFFTVNSNAIRVIASGITNGMSFSSTNAVSKITSNSTDIVSPATTLNFVAGTNLAIIDSGSGVATVVIPTNTPSSVSGSGTVTNVSVRAGAGILITGKTNITDGGTNTIAIDSTVVATKSDLSGYLPTSTTLGGLYDTAIGSGYDWDVLRWDNYQLKWVNSQLTDFTNYNGLRIADNITYGVATNTAGTNLVFYIDLSKAMQELRVTNSASLTFHTTNRAPGLCSIIRIKQTSAASLSMSFNSGWTNFVGSPPPTKLSSNVWAILSLSCWGGDETNVLAGYAVQPY